MLGGECLVKSGHARTRPVHPQDTLAERFNAMFPIGQPVSFKFKNRRIYTVTEQYAFATYTQEGKRAVVYVRGEIHPVCVENLDVAARLS